MALDEFEDIYVCSDENCKWGGITANPCLRESPPSCCPVCGKKVIEFSDEEDIEE